MSVATKGKRKIEVDGRRYVWYVADDFDSAYKVLNVISEDKHVILTVPLHAPSAYVICKGSVFQGKKTSGTWERYALPYAVPDAIIPSFVADVIQWSVGDNGAVAVAWDGKQYPV